jgi:hypothetical protein
MRGVKEMLQTLQIQKRHCTLQYGFVLVASLCSMLTGTMRRRVGEGRLGLELLGLEFCLKVTQDGPGWRSGDFGIDIEPDSETGLRQCRVFGLLSEESSFPVGEKVEKWAWHGVVSYASLPMPHTGAPP